MSILEVSLSADPPDLADTSMDVNEKKGLTDYY